MSQFSPFPFGRSAPELPQAQASAFRWATVIGVDPLRILFDGDSKVLPYEPNSLVDRSTLVEGDRLWVQIHGRQVVIIGQGGGAGIDPATLEATIDARVNALFNGLFDTRFNNRRAWYRPQTYHSNIIGNTWETVPNTWTTKQNISWSVPGAGSLFIVQTADLIDRATAAGDPEFRLQTVSGPISSFSQNDGFIGSDQGGGTTTGAVSTTAECDITGSGTVVLSCERRSSSSSTTDLQIRNWNIRGIFSPDVLGVT